MVTIENLSNNILSIGKNLLNQIKASHAFKVDTAYWKYNEENSCYELWIISPSVKSQGPLKIYHKIEDLLDSAQKNIFNSNKIKICNTNHPEAKIVKLLKLQYGQVDVAQESNNKLGWNIGNFNDFQGLYIYR